MKAEQKTLGENLFVRERDSKGGVNEAVTGRERKMKKKEKLKIKLQGICYWIEEGSMGRADMDVGREGYDR